MAKRVRKSKASSAHAAQSEAAALRSDHDSASKSETTTGVLQVTHEPPLEEAVRLRVYFLYLERGSNEGRPLEDWLRAEKEILRAPAAALSS